MPSLRDSPQGSIVEFSIRRRKRRFALRGVLVGPVPRSRGRSYVQVTALPPGAPAHFAGTWRLADCHVTAIRPPTWKALAVLDQTKASRVERERSARVAAIAGEGPFLDRLAAAIAAGTPVRHAGTPVTVLALDRLTGRVTIASPASGRRVSVRAHALRCEVRPGPAALPDLTIPAFLADGGSP